MLQNTQQIVTMNKQLSLPMYDICRRDTQALWSVLKPLIVAEGLATERLDIVWPEDNLETLWRSDAMLLSQTCGYPLATKLTQVQVMGCFQYSAPGCEAHRYRSYFIARIADEGKQLADFRGRKAVCNSRDSQSGYNALRKMVAPLAREGHFFAGVDFSGSHRQSLEEVRCGNADIAAIDCITWALLQRHESESLRDLTLIGQSPLAPGLPLITAAQTSAQNRRAIRNALVRLVNEPAYREVCAAVYISGFSEISRTDYDVILDWEREAAEYGVLSL